MKLIKNLNDEKISKICGFLSNLPNPALSFPANYNNGISNFFSPNKHNNLSATGVGLYPCLFNFWDR